MASAGPVGGLERLRAWLTGVAYDKHRHDSYAVCVTDRGVQRFDYRGATHTSTRGDVVVLYPDEVHDGRAGTASGFGYRIVYVEPSRLAEALAALCGRACPLPFVPDAVSASPRLARAVADAFRAPLEPLAVDAVVLALAAGLLAAAPARARGRASPRIDVAALERAREFLDAERTRVVRSAELEAITGLTRYDLARQFKRLLGTSPYRYLLMRRLDLARRLVTRGERLAEVAHEAGFADQAHLTRTFKSAFGLTPARYRALGVRGPAPDRGRRAFPTMTGRASGR